MHSRNWVGSEYHLDHLKVGRFVDANDSNRLLIVYLAVLVAITPLLWFILPETKGKSLEEIGLIFGDRHTRINLEDTATPPVEEETGTSEKQNDTFSTKGSRHVEV